MAKGARSSSRKANNVALKSKVFGPIESARNERMQAKLLALIAQPKPTPVQKDVEMEVAGGMLAARCNAWMPSLLLY